MNPLTLLFVLAVALMLATRLWLEHRQLRHVIAHRNQVPEAFADRIPLEAHRRAADYTVAKTRVARWETAYDTLLLLGWTYGGGIEWLDRGWRSLQLSSLYTGVGVMVSAFALMGLLQLPFTLYRTFGLEQRFGFNHTTPALFLSDLAKQILLVGLLVTPLIAVVLWLMTIAGRGWWFYVWLVWMGFSLLLLWAYPAFIAPLFNKFIPLDDDALRRRIESLLQRCGFAASGVYVMDGSRRSAHGNAYFTGLGRNKRIVFYDTLLNGLDGDELEAVLAHELGHFRRHHVRRRIIASAVFSLAGLALLGWLLPHPWFYYGLGVSTPSVHVALLLFLLVIPVFTFFLQPLLTARMRRHEFEADDFAAQQAGPQFLIRALVKLYEENANTLTPDPLYSAFHDSHPPAPVRVAHLSTKMHNQ